MIAITGATGLLGNYICRKLAETEQKLICLRQTTSNVAGLSDINHKIIWREANVLDTGSLHESLSDADTLIHTAALVSFNPRKAKTIFKVNVEGTQNVVNVCLDLGIKKLIHISSIAALGRQGNEQVITEDSKWVDSTLESDYAESKYLSELEVYRGQEEGLHVAMVNPSVILAPGDWSRSSAQLFRYVWQQKPFYTDGLINFVDVRDVAEMVRVLTYGNFNGERFIASAGSIALIHLFEQIASRFNRTPPYIKVAPSLTAIVAALEAVRSALLQREPLITRQTARLAKEKFHYDNKKTTTQLGIRFRSLEETLDWCCQYFLQHNTTNK